MIKGIRIGSYWFNSKKDFDAAVSLATKQNIKTLDEFEKFMLNEF